MQSTKVIKKRPFKITSPHYTVLASGKQPLYDWKEVSEKKLQYTNPITKKRFSITLYYNRKSACFCFSEQIRG